MALLPTRPPYCASASVLLVSAFSMNPCEECHLRMRFRSASMRCRVRSRWRYGLPGSFSRYRFQIVCQQMKVWVCLRANTSSRWMSCIRWMPLVVTGSPGCLWCWSLRSILYIPRCRPDGDVAVFSGHFLKHWTTASNGMGWVWSSRCGIALLWCSRSNCVVVLIWRLGLIGSPLQIYLPNAMRLSFSRSDLRCSWV